MSSPYIKYTHFIFYLKTQINIDLLDLLQILLESKELHGLTLDFLTVQKDRSLILKNMKHIK